MFFGFEGSAVAGTVTGSTAAANDVGIYARVVTGCTATTNKTHGIRVTSVAKDNDASHNGDGGNGAGIYFTGVGVRIEGNNCFDNDWGIQSEQGADGFIVRNSARGNGGAGRPGPTNAGASSAYDFDRATNTYGPVRIVNGDLSGDALASNPWANIQY